MCCRHNSTEHNQQGVIYTCRSLESSIPLRSAPSAALFSASDGSRSFLSASSAVRFSASCGTWHSICRNHSTVPAQQLSTCLRSSSSSCFFRFLASSSPFSASCSSRFLFSLFSASCGSFLFFASSASPSCAAFVTWSRLLAYVCNAAKVTLEATSTPHLALVLH